MPPVDVRTDLDFLTELMRAKQRVVYGERQVEGAKAELKEARNELNALLDTLEPHVQKRRDELHMPRFPSMDIDTNLKPKPDDEPGEGDEEDGA